MDERVMVWSEGVRVRAYEVGPDGAAGMPALCDWLQEAAGNHAPGQWSRAGARSNTLAILPCVRVNRRDGTVLAPQPERTWSSAIDHTTPALHGLADSLQHIPCDSRILARLLRRVRRSTMWIASAFMAVVTGR